jgi:hypothetical protein
MRVRVQCYSGRKADERPIRFRVDEREYVVEELLDQWYGPEEAWYKVRADDGNIYILRQQTSVPDGTWDLVSFRRAAG